LFKLYEQVKQRDEYKINLCVFAARRSTITHKHRNGSRVTNKRYAG